jgi:hypothetical protein
VDPAAPTLPFDHFERYHLTARVLGELDSGQSLDLLDVGGHFSSLKLLRPDDHLTVADPKPRPAFAYRPDVPFRCDRYVQALGGRLPFRDASFDAVAAHDTLEHVPAEHRRTFLDDLARVSGRFLLLNGPVHSDEAVAAERRIDQLWREGLGAEEHALDEHLRLGLPRSELVEGWLGERGMPFASIPNGNLGTWTAMMALKSYLQGLPDAELLHGSLDRLFNASLAPGDRRPPCYRVAYVAARDQQDAETIVRVRRAFPPLDTAPAADPDALPAFVDHLEAHLVRMRALITELRSSLDDVNKEASWRQQRIDELEARLAELGPRRGTAGP